MRTSARVHLLQESRISGRPGPGGPGRGDKSNTRGWIGCCGVGREAPWDLIGEQWGTHNPYVDYGRVCMRIHCASGVSVCTGGVFLSLMLLFLLSFLALSLRCMQQLHGPPAGAVRRGHGALVVDVWRGTRGACMGIKWSWAWRTSRWRLARTPRCVHGHHVVLGMAH